MTLVHTTTAFSKRSHKAQEFEGMTAGEGRVQHGETKTPEANRRERRLIRRRRRG